MEVLTKKLNYSITSVSNTVLNLFSSNLHCISYQKFLLSEISQYLSFDLYAQEHLCMLYSDLKFQWLW